MNRFDGWRTRILGVLLGAAGLLQIYDDVIPPVWQGRVLLAAGLAVIVLRQLTQGPPAPVEIPEIFKRR